MNTPSPPPRPRAEPLEESWDDLVVGALGDTAREQALEEDPHVFDRATAVPSRPPEGSGLELASLEPPPPTRRGTPQEFRLPAPPGFGSEPPERAGSLPFRREPPLPYSGDVRSDVRTDVPGQRPSPQRASDPNLDRRRTAPEPIVERFLDRVEAGAPSPAARLGRGKNPEPLELDLGGIQDSPLELAETYRRATQNLPAVTAAQADPSEPPDARTSGTVRDMQDRYAVGDFTGALVVAESILDSDPDNEDADRYARSCREVLTQMYAARIGPMDQIATVAVPPDQITWLSLDHRAGFLLSLVDGISSIEEILDISGMTRLDALRIMYTLVQQNVLVLNG